MDRGTARRGQLLICGRVIEIGQTYAHTERPRTLSLNLSFQQVVRQRKYHTKVRDTEIKSIIPPYKNTGSHQYSNRRKRDGQGRTQKLGVRVQRNGMKKV